MIYIIGDTHGEMEINKLSNRKVLQQTETFPDYVIVLGDFGLLWRDSPTELYWQNWLDKKPWTTLFIDGNHENHEMLALLEKVPMFGSEVGKVSDKIFHLKRGQVYTIEDKTFLTFGGAMSIDKETRSQGLSWWPQEIPDYNEFFRAGVNLKMVNNTVDYILTHTCPTNIIMEIYKHYSIDDFIYSEPKYKDPTCDLLNTFQREITFKKWFFGHFHEDGTYLDKYTVSYLKGHIIR